LPTHTIKILLNNAVSHAPQSPDQPKQRIENINASTQHFETSPAIMFTGDKIRPSIEADNK
jgi:hypothetical protein